MLPAEWMIVVAGTLALVSCAGGPKQVRPSPVASTPPANDVRVSGAFSASTPAQGSPGGCSFDARTQVLKWSSGALIMDSGNGEVVRVAFVLAAIRMSPQTYSATTPKGDYGFTPLVMTTARNAATGAGATSVALDGQIRVEAADAEKGRFWGTLDGDFSTFPGGEEHVAATWVCLSSSP